MENTSRDSGRVFDKKPFRIAFYLNLRQNSLLFSKNII